MSKCPWKLLSALLVALVLSICPKTFFSVHMKNKYVHHALVASVMTLLKQNTHNERNKPQREIRKYLFFPMLKLCIVDCFEWQINALWIFVRRIPPSLTSSKSQKLCFIIQFNWNCMAKINFTSNANCTDLITMWVFFIVYEFGCE